MGEDDMAFLNLVLLLGTMASQRLDALAQPSGKTPQVREELLPKSRESINMLVALKKRTQGRLTSDEERVVETLIKNLQLRYVQALGLKPAAPPA